MITAVDSNVLIDIFNDDKDFADLSAAALRKAINYGACVACEAVWAEVATGFMTQEAFKMANSRLGINFSHITEESALLAGDYWRKYRNRGGKRNRISSDFLIGAHALNQCGRLLTRDSQFYRTCFKKLKILDPTD